MIPYFALGKKCLSVCCQQTPIPWLDIRSDIREARVQHAEPPFCGKSHSCRLPWQNKLKQHPHTPKKPMKFLPQATYVLRKAEDRS